MGVQVVSLALASPGGTIGPVHLDDQLAVGAQPACKPGAVAASAFHADAIHRPEPPRPAKQRSIAARGGGNCPGAKRPAGLVERDGDVAVGMGVDAEGDEHLGVWQGGQGHRLLLACGCSVARTSRTADSTAMGPVGQALIRSLRQTGGAEDARPDRPTDPIPASKASGFQGSDRQGGRLDHHPRSGSRLRREPSVAARALQAKGSCAPRTRRSQP
jgi:hypothetical protein